MPISTTMDQAMLQAIRAQMAGQKSGGYQASPLQSSAAPGLLPPTTQLDGSEPSAQPNPLDAQPIAGNIPAAPANMPMPGPAPAAPSAQAAAPAASAAAPRTYDWSPGGKDSNEVRQAMGYIPLPSAPDNSPEAIAARKADMDRVNQNLAAVGMPTSGQQADGSWNMRIESGGQPARVVNSLGRSPSVGVQKGGQTQIGVPNQTPGGSPMGQPTGAAPGAAPDFNTWAAQQEAERVQRENDTADAYTRQAYGSGFGATNPAAAAAAQRARMAAVTPQDPEAYRQEYNQQANNATLQQKYGLTAGPEAQQAMKGQNEIDQLKYKNDALAMQGAEAEIQSRRATGATVTGKDVDTIIAQHKDLASRILGSPSTSPPMPGNAATPTMPPGGAANTPPSSPWDDPTVGGGSTKEELNTAIGQLPKGNFDPQAIAQLMIDHPTVAKSQLPKFAEAIRQQGYTGGSAVIDKAMQQAMIRNATDGGMLGSVHTTPLGNSSDKADLGGMTLERGPTGYVVRPNIPDQPNQFLPYPGQRPPGAPSTMLPQLWPFGQWNEGLPLSHEAMQQAKLKATSLSALYRALHSQE